MSDLDVVARNLAKSIVCVGTTFATTAQEFNRLALSLRETLDRIDDRQQVFVLGDEWVKIAKPRWWSNEPDRKLYDVSWT